MNNLKLMTYFTILSLALIGPACKNTKKKKQERSIATESYSKQKSEKSFFDNDLEAFVIDADASPFDMKNDFVLVDEDSENDVVIEQSRYGFMPIYFEFDADTVKPGQSGVLENNLARAKKLVLEGKKIVIEGHACKIAVSAEYNMHLSEKRAKAIYTYFVKNGIPQDKITVKGCGSELCLVQQGTKEQQAPNRRVEFIAIDIA